METFYFKIFLTKFEENKINCETVDLKLVLVIQILALQVSGIPVSSLTTLCNCL